MYNIYTLRCPLVNKVVYVGKTKLELEKRLVNHLSDKSNAKKRQWVLTLKSKNVKPLISLVQVCDNNKDANLAEHRLIKWYNKEYPLLNGKNSDGFKKRQITIQLSKAVVLAVENEAKQTGKSKQVVIDERLKQAYGI